MMMKILWLIVAVFLLSACSKNDPQKDDLTAQNFQQVNWATVLNNNKHLQYSYEITHQYPHDTNSFTEGLTYDAGVLMESSGLYYRSTLRKIEMQTGKVLQEIKLPNHFFAEGITDLNDRVYQLTYESNECLVYNKNDLALQKSFRYPFQGWGLTNDGTSLIMSDGSAALNFINPKNFAIDHFIIAHIGKDTVGSLNELEYIDGKIYANVFGEQIIVIISSKDGEVVGLIDLSKLHPKLKADSIQSVMNGIAYDSATNNLLVTGKNWPVLYALKLKPLSSGRTSD
jgi:glutamine cyclotransferase